MVTKFKYQELICKIICDKVREMMQSEENRKEFEEWYFTKYGKKYIWKHPK